MTIEFDLQTLPNSSDTGILQSPFTFEIILVDDKGKEYKHNTKEGGTLKIDLVINSINSHISVANSEISNSQKIFYFDLNCT